MIAHVILTRISDIEILKSAFKMISPKHTSLQMRKLSLASPHDLLKALQRISIP